MTTPQKPEPLDLTPTENPWLIARDGIPFVSFDDKQVYMHANSVSHGGLSPKHSDECRRLLELFEKCEQNIITHSDLIYTLFPSDDYGRNHIVNNFLRKGIYFFDQGNSFKPGSMQLNYVILR